LSIDVLEDTVFVSLKYSSESGH